MRQIVFAAPARKTLGRMQPAKRGDVLAAVERYAAAPQAKYNNVAPLTGRKGAVRIRVGDWRVICELTPEAVVVWDVLPRGGAYTKKHGR